MLEPCILLMFDGTAVVACVGVGGWVSMVSTYRRCAREVVGDVAFQVLVDIGGIQVPLNNGGKFCIHLGREIQQKGL